MCYSCVRELAKGGRSKFKCPQSRKPIEGYGQVLGTSDLPDTPPATPDSSADGFEDEAEELGAHDDLSEVPASEARARLEQLLERYPSPTTMPLWAGEYHDT